MKSSANRRKNLTNENPNIETVLDFHGKYRKYILSGTKRCSIRLGRRTFARKLNICGFHGTVNSQIYYKHLAEVPFEVFQKEDWTSFAEALTELRNIYPEITPESDVTIVEFRIDVPPREVFDSNAPVCKP
jgi:hypothetical protein